MENEANFRKEKGLDNKSVDPRLLQVAMEDFHLLLPHQAVQVKKGAKVVFSVCWADENLWGINGQILTFYPQGKNGVVSIVFDYAFNHRLRTAKAQGIDDVQNPYL
jgi:hypothetical protein